MSALPDEVELVRVQGWVNAESIVAALRGSGIPARTQGESIGHIYGLTLDGLGEVIIFVPKEYAEEALTLLKAGENGGLEPDVTLNGTESDDL